MDLTACQPIWKYKIMNMGHDIALNLIGFPEWFAFRSSHVKEFDIVKTL